MEAVFSFVDLAGFTAATDAHGDTTAAEIALHLVAETEATLLAEQRLVKSVGDAVLVTSSSPTTAIEWVARLLPRLRARANFPLARVGLHAGSAVERGSDVFGGAVNVAARITALALPGQVLSSGLVAESVRALSIETTDLGEIVLRNVADPIRLFELRVSGSGYGGAIDPVCQMPVDRDAAAGKLRHDCREYWFCSLECTARFAQRPEVYAAPRLGSTRNC
ncbi:MAG: YHS domain-containing protein [Actinobacteria bacterium]|nr:YHS domain-containing protein [Actinomycetota bacterium]